MYKESTRLLKGAGWKVNFRSRGDYEDVRAREIGVGGDAGREVGLGALLHPIRSEAHRVGYCWLEGAADQFRRDRRAGPLEPTALREEGASCTRLRPTRSRPTAAATSQKWQQCRKNNVAKWERGREALSLALRWHICGDTNS